MATYYGPTTGSIFTVKPPRYVYDKSIIADGSISYTTPIWVRIHVIGKGGSGGRGGNATAPYRWVGSAAYASGGSSGSTGAYAVHEVFLPIATSISVTIGANQTAATVAGTTIVARNGVNGYDAASLETMNYQVILYGDPVAPSNASTVISSGGNLANYSGTTGNASQSGSVSSAGANSNIMTGTYAIYTPKSAALGGAGGNNGNGSAGESSLNSNLLFGGAGAGGGGGVAINDDGLGLVTSGGAGGSGGNGGVVIEIAYYS